MAEKPPPELTQPLRPPEQAREPHKRSGRRRERGTQLTVEVSRAIVASIAAGNFPSVACRLAQISDGTLDRWLKRGGKDEQPYANFPAAYHRAELESESKLVEIWKNAAPEDWRAAKEFLARRYPERWSDHAARVAVLGDEGRMADFGFVINIHLDPVAEELEEARKEKPAIDVMGTPRLDKDK